MLVLRERSRRRAVDVDQPQVVGAVSIAHECHALAVGRIARLTVERHARREGLRFAPLDRQRVEVANQVEKNRLAVRRDIDRDPGSLVGRELDRPVRLERQTMGLLPGGLFLILFAGLLFVFSLLFHRGRHASSAEKAAA